MMFDSLEQRLAHSYLETFPAFVPDENSLDLREQEHFYDFMKRLYQLAYDQPLLWVPTLHEDDAYPNHSTKKAYNKPDLHQHMRKFMQGMDGLLQSLFEMGKGVAVKPSKRQMAILAALGHDESAPRSPAWTWMATRPGANLPAFAHCFFRADYSYVSDLYAHLLGDEPAFRRLETWMLNRGYQRYMGLDVTASTDPISLTYANPAWSAETPRGGYEYTIRHTGIAAIYHIELQRPAVFGLCIPGGLKPFLAAFADMDATVQRFVWARTKICDGCRYCVQTDKTGTRPLASIVVTHEGEVRRLCPYFPGYSYSWTSIDDALVDELIAMLAFMDGFVPSVGPRKRGGFALMDA